MHTIIVGLNHKTAHVSIREKFHFSENKIERALKNLSEFPEIKGCVILSTCNRVEIYGAVEDTEKGYNDIITFISKFQNIKDKDLIPYIYKKADKDAVMHLFNVVASLDSMVVGEYQIQGQVRDAYDIAEKNDCTQPMLNKLFQTAIQIGKRIRSSTGIGDGAVSVASTAVDMVREIFGNGNRFNVLLIGAGKISELTAANLRQSMNCKITVSNRAKSKALELAGKFDCDTIEFEDRYKAIIKNEVVIVSTGADDYVINKDILTKSFNNAKKTETFFIDLSVPRNIEPEINDISNVTLFSIDDLKERIDINIKKRANQIENVKKIISEVSKDYFIWYATQTIVPVMKVIKNEFDNLGLRTLMSYRSLMDSMTQEQRDLVHEMLKNHTAKIIRIIMKNLRRGTKSADYTKIAENLKNTFNINIDDEKNDTKEETQCPYKSKPALKT